MWDNFEGYFYALAFLVPGFICNLAISTFVVQKRDEAQVLVIRLLTLSCINYAFWSWLIYLLYTSTWLASVYFQAFAWFIILLVSPIVLGLALGYLRQNAYPERLLRGIGFTPLAGDSTAWDYKLRRVEEPTNVIVTLDDGTEVAGLFWDKSFASVAQDGGDLYLEENYQADPRKKTWVSIPGGDGVYIAGKHIKQVEFFVRDKETSDGGKRK